MIYSEKGVLLALIEVAACLNWQEDSTTRWNEYACMGFLKYVLAHRGRVLYKAEGCVIERPLESCRGHAVDEMKGGK